MPGYRFPRDPVPTPTPLSPSFIDFFVSDPPLSDLRDGLEEYAWRCLIDGKRVRTYCAEISSVFDSLPSEPALTLCTALQYPSLSVLFPLVTISESNNNEIVPPPQLLPAASLLSLSRKQLIDVLSRLSRDQRIIDGDVEGLRGQVLELCLEYVGRRWRGSDRGGEEDFVDGIARKLTEIAFEIQLQGHPVTVRSVLLPILHTLRFTLGLVSSNQLVTRLNSAQNPSVRSNVHFDSEQIITSWLIIRLRAGSDPQRLVDDLVSVRDKLRIDEDRDSVTDVLSSYGLLGRNTGSRDDSILAQFGVPPTSSLPQHQIDSSSSVNLFSAATKPKSFSLAHRMSIKRPAPIITNAPTQGKLWSHRRNNSSSLRLSHLAPFLSVDRRPSLPVISSPSLLASMPNNSAPVFYQSSSSLGATASATRLSMMTHRESPTVQDLLASLLTYDKPEDIRFILLDHLLGMRFQLTSDASDDWVLGQGKITADDVLSVLETRLVGRRDVMGLKAVFTDLRKLFNLPPAALPVASGYKPKHRSVDDVAVKFPTVPVRQSVSSTSSEMPEPAESIHETASIATFGFTERGSFDLDQYYTDIAPEGESHKPFELNLVPLDKIASKRNTWRKSYGNNSIYTTMTGYTGPTGITPQRASMLSDFTIREAKREYQSEHTATSIHLPRRVMSLTKIELSSVCDRSIRHDVPSSDFTYTWVKSNRASVSEPDLLEMIRALDISDSDDEGDMYGQASLNNHGRRVSRSKMRPAYIRPTQNNLAYAPPAIPTIPSIPSLGTYEYRRDSLSDDSDSTGGMASIPSLSSEDYHPGSRSAVNVPKNMAGFNTPPASPPIVDASTITFTLDEVPLSPDMTPVGKGNREFNRQWAIVDGEHVSPPRPQPADNSPSPGLDEYATAPNTPRPPHNVPSERGMRPPRSTLSALNGGPDLRSIVGLFSTSSGSVLPRDNLGEWEVRVVLRDIVDSHRGECGLARWLLLHLSDMLGEAYVPMINSFLFTLEHSRAEQRDSGEITPRRPNGVRHHTYPSTTSSDYPLTPPPPPPIKISSGEMIPTPKIPVLPLLPLSPLSPDSPDSLSPPPLTHLPHSTSLPAMRPKGRKERSRIKARGNGKGGSKDSLGSYGSGKSVNTFGV